MFEKSYFRRYMLKPVTKATSNDLRAHLELALFYNVDKYPVHKSVVRNHMGHSKLVSQRHFHASSRDALNNLLGHVLPGGTFKRKRIVTCACYLCMLLLHVTCANYLCMLQVHVTCACHLCICLCICLCSLCSLCSLCMCFCLCLSSTVVCFWACWCKTCCLLHGCLLLGLLV